MPRPLRPASPSISTSISSPSACPQRATTRYRYFARRVAQQREKKKRKRCSILLPPSGKRIDRSIDLTISITCLATWIDVRSLPFFFRFIVFERFERKVPFLDNKKKKKTERKKKKKFLLCWSDISASLTVTLHTRLAREPLPRSLIAVHEITDIRGSIEGTTRGRHDPRFINRAAIEAALTPVRNV